MNLATPSPDAALSIAFAAGRNLGNWDIARQVARQHPEATLAWLRQEKLLDLACRWHHPQALLIYAEVALYLNQPVEAGWALYLARVLNKGVSSLPAALQQAAVLTHPVWHQPVRGTRVTLVRPQARHRAFLEQTLAQQDFVARYNAYLGPASVAAQGYLHRVQQPAHNLRQLDWVIENRQGEAVGLASLADLVWGHRRGELLIGFPDRPQARLSLEASLLVLAVAFHCLDLQRVVSYVYANNDHAQKSTLSVGFTHEGTLRRQIMRPDQPQGIDLHVNGMLTEEFNTNARLQRLWRTLFEDKSPAHLFAGVRLEP